MQPRLIHPQLVTARIRLASVVNDSSLGEPSGRVEGEVVQFTAQVSYGSPLESQKIYGVTMPEARGHLIALNKGVAATLAKGDRITAIGGMTVAWVVLDNVPAGHYAAPTLRYIPFAEANS